MEGFQALCHICHSKKSEEERGVRKELGTLKMRHHREYNSWKSMNARCLNENHDAYHNYGGRGIGICPQWSEFEVFLKDMGRRGELLTLDRIDVNEGYSPDNCKWSTYQGQANNRTDSRLITHGGFVRTLSGWARELGIPTTTIRNRLERGKSVEESLRKKPYRQTLPWVDIIRDYEVMGLNIKELAYKYDCHYKTLSRRLNKKEI